MSYQYLNNWNISFEWSHMKRGNPKTKHRIFKSLDWMSALCSIRHITTFKWPCFAAKWRGVVWNIKYCNWKTLHLYLFCNLEGIQQYWCDRFSMPDGVESFLWKPIKTTISHILFRFPDKKILNNIQMAVRDCNMKRG